MSFWKNLCLIFLCVGALIVLCGCQQPPEETGVTTTVQTEPPLSAEEKYLQGREHIDQASNWILSYTTEEKRTIGTDIYTQAVSGTASYSNLMQSDMTVVVEENLSYGTYRSNYLELYCEGDAYVQVNGSNFKETMTPKMFIQRQIPAVLLSSGLYQTITETVLEDATVISFSEATEVEEWVSGKKAKLISASGTATLDNTGVLKETNYHVEYQLGECKYEFSASVQVTAPQTLDLGGTHQEHLKGSIQLEDVSIPKMLLQVVGNIYTAGSIQCTATETIYSEAIPLSYSQKSQYNLTGAGETLNARAEYLTSMSDYRGEAASQTWTESFADGKYTTTRENAGNVSATAEQMRQYLEDAILSALVAPIYLNDATLQEKGTLYRLELTGNHQFVIDMMKNIASFLQVDLESKATTGKTVSAGGYLTIHKETGLPLSMGLYLEREHTMDSGTYQLTYQLDQTLALSETE